MCSGVCLRASTELTWGRIVKQNESMAPSALGSVFESIHGSVLESVLRAYLGACNEVHLAALFTAA